jgi:DNA polymerase-1
MQAVGDLEHVQLHLVDSVDTAQDCLSWLGTRRESGVVAVDLETGELPGRPKSDALSAYHGRIRLAQIGDENHGWAIPWEDWKGVFYQAMERWEGHVITHNVAFEGKWLSRQSRWDFPWHRVDDTMIAAQIVDPLGSAALKSLTSRYVDRRAAIMQQTLDQAMTTNGWTWGTVPIHLREYWAYGALDTVLTVHLWQYLRDQVEIGGAFRLVYDLEMATRRICTKMEMNGARVDLEYSRQKYQELHDYADQVRSWARGTYRGLNIGSNAQLVRQFERLNVEITSLTPSGQKSMDKDQLKLIVRDYPGEAAALAQYSLYQRKADKLAETYFANILSDHNDGLIHASIRSIGARTGRMSISSPGPALQTLPKSDKVVRTAFIPRNSDEVLLSSDLDQVEFRMTASLARDPGLIDLFARCDRDGGDAFTEIMREVYRDPSLQKDDPRRRLIKGTVYGKLYGAGIPKMALTSGVPEEQMKQVVHAFDANYPGVKLFSQQVEDVGVRRQREEGQAYITTATGRRLPADEGKVYTLVNYAIQGGAAEVFKLDMLKCDAAGLTDYLVVPVHDELVFSVPRKDAEELRPVIKELMTTREGWAVPLTAGISRPGPNWGNLSD